MGKKGRKTRWRSFAIGEEEENGATSHAATNSTSSSSSAAHPISSTAAATTATSSTVQIRNEWKNVKEHLYDHHHQQQTQYLGHHQQHNNVQQRSHESTTHKLSKYHNSNATTNSNSWFRGQSTTHNAAAGGGDYRTGKKLSFDMKKDGRNYYNKTRDYNGNAYGNEVKPKPTFNEDEYTKISTPRQDVLFKKGYLSRPKTKPSAESSDNTSSIATTADELNLLNLESGNSSTISSIPSASPDISQYANNLDYNLSQFPGYYDETGAFIPNPLLMNGYNFYNGQQIFMIPYNNAAQCQNYNYMDYNNYNNTNLYDNKMHNHEQGDVVDGEEVEATAAVAEEIVADGAVGEAAGDCEPVANEIIESEVNNNADESAKLSEDVANYESLENGLANMDYMSLDTQPPPYLIYGYYPFIAPIISNNLPLTDAAEPTELKDNKPKQFLQKKRKRKIRSTMNISSNNSTSDYSGDESASSDEATLNPVNETTTSTINISKSQLNVEVKEFQPRWIVNNVVAAAPTEETKSSSTTKVDEKIKEVVKSETLPEKKRHSPKIDSWIVIGAKGKQKSPTVPASTDLKLPSDNDLQKSNVPKINSGNSNDKNKKPVVNMKPKMKKLKKNRKHKYNVNGSISNTQQNGFEIIEPDFMSKSTDSTDSQQECDGDVMQTMAKAIIETFEPQHIAPADEEEIVEIRNEDNNEVDVDEVIELQMDPVVEEVMEVKYIESQQSPSQLVIEAGDDDVDEEVFAHIDDLPIEECDNNEEELVVSTEEKKEVAKEIASEPKPIRITEQVLQWIGDKKNENVVNSLFIVPENPAIIAKFQIFKRNLQRDFEYRAEMKRKRQRKYSEGDEEADEEDLDEEEDEEDVSNDDADGAYDYYDENEDEMEYKRKNRMNSNTTDTDSDYMSDIQIKNSNCKDLSLSSPLSSPLTSPKAIPLTDDADNNNKSLLINDKDLSSSSNCNGNHSSSNSKINKTNDRIHNSKSSAKNATVVDVAAGTNSSRKKLGCPIM